MLLFATTVALWTVTVAAQTLTQEQAALRAAWMENTHIRGIWSEEAPQVFDFENPLLSDDFPATRYLHTAITDPQTRRMIVMMGYFYNHRAGTPTWLGDTWAYSYDDAVWTRIHDGHDPAPRPRYGHSAVVYGREVYVFGGGGSQQSTPNRPISEFEGGELWTFNLDTHIWTLKHATSPSGHGPHARSLHTCALLKTGQGDFMLLHGGMLHGVDRTHVDDTWLYNFKTETWSPPSHPLAISPGDRYGATLTSVRDRAYLFGGASREPNRVVNDLWIFSFGLGWSKIIPNQDAVTLPSSRNYHSSVIVDEIRGTAAGGLVMFAGADCTGSCICNSDTWIFDIAEQIWFPVVITGIISTRYHQTLTFFEDKLYTFGGESFQPKYMYHNSVQSLRFKLVSDSTLFDNITSTTVIVFLVIIFVLAVIIIRSYRRQGPRNILPTKR